VHVYFVYMLASRRDGVLYVGVTNDLRRRVEEHRLGQHSRFTRHYNVHNLVWHEVHHDSLAAIGREKLIKKWRRAWKVALIEVENPEWRDLYPELLDWRRQLCSGSRVCIAPCRVPRHAATRTG
jgi:putative endonuclease